MNELPTWVTISIKQLETWTSREHRSRWSQWARFHGHTFRALKWSVISHFLHFIVTYDRTINSRWQMYMDWQFHVTKPSQGMKRSFLYFRFFLVILLPIRNELQIGYPVFHWVLSFKCNEIKNRHYRSLFTNDCYSLPLVCYKNIYATLTILSDFKSSQILNKPHKDTQY